MQNPRIFETSTKKSRLDLSLSTSIKSEEDQVDKERLYVAKLPFS